jgi:hypothetical protein
MKKMVYRKLQPVSSRRTPQWRIIYSLREAEIVARKLKAIDVIHRVQDAHCNQEI